MKCSLVLGEKRTRGVLEKACVLFCGTFLFLHAVVLLLVSLVC